MSRPEAVSKPDVAVSLHLKVILSWLLEIATFASLTRNDTNVAGLTPIIDNGFPCQLGVEFFVITVPVKYVEAKINAKGIHVPSGLRNMSKLLLITMATTKKSTTITKPVKISAVLSGDV